MATADNMSSYTEWLAGLTDDELENEEYTVREEWRIIGMRATDAERKRFACETERTRRMATRFGS